MTCSEGSAASQMRARNNLQKICALWVLRSTAFCDRITFLSQTASHVDPYRI
jgi:hypothetical protein